MEYERLAAVYDDLMYDAPAEKWATYILGFVSRPSCIIEYACGTGRLTEQFLRAGIETIAVDSSEAMLNEAGRKLRPLGRKLHLVQAPMQEFAAPERADFAICACDGVNYVLNEADLSSFFRHVFENLRPGGSFALDISSAYKLKHILGNNFFYDDADDKTVFWQCGYRSETETCEMDLTVFVQEKDGFYSRFDERHVQKAWSQEAIVGALEDAAFSDVHAYEFGTLRPPSGTTERIQFYAKKETQG